MKIEPAELEAFKQTLPTDLQKEVFCWLTHEYDIVAARFLIHKLSLPKRSIDVTAWATALGMAGPQNTDKLSFNMITGVSDLDALKPEIDYTHPLIIAEHTFKSGRKTEVTSLVIDGNHRLRKAFIEKVEKLEAYVIERKFINLIRQ